MDFVIGVFHQGRIADQQRDQYAEQQTKGGGGKCAKRKPLEHLVQGNHEAAKTEPDEHAEHLAMVDGGKFRTDLADGVTRRGAQAQKQKANSPKLRHGGWLVSRGGVLVEGSSWCQRKRHNPRRFKLLEATARLAATACTLVESCSFSSKAPARPLPDCKSSVNFFKVSVEDSMFFTAAEISALFVEIKPWASAERWMRSCEKKTTLLTARPICVPLVATSALRLATVFVACSEIVRRLSMVSAKLVNVCSIQHQAAHIGDGGIELFRRFINPLDETGGGAGGFLQIERRFALHVCAVGPERQLIFRGNDRDVLVAEKAGLLNDEPRVVVNLVCFVNSQQNGHAFAIRRQFNHRRHCRPAHRPATPRRVP